MAVHVGLRHLKEQTSISCWLPSMYKARPQFVLTAALTGGVHGPPSAGERLGCFSNCGRGPAKAVSEPRGRAQEWLQGGAVEMALKNPQDFDIWKGQDSRHWGVWAESIQWRWAGEASRAILWGLDAAMGYGVLCLLHQGAGSDGISGSWLSWQWSERE